MKNKLIAILALVVLAVGCLSLVACKEEEEPIPWWEDLKNMNVVLEDDRTVEKTAEYIPGSEKQLEFNYTYNEFYEKECIPNVTFYYNGEEKGVVKVVQSRERYYENLDSYNSVGIVKGIGRYRVSIYYYRNQDDADNMRNLITGTVISIIITKGE